MKAIVIALSKSCLLFALFTFCLHIPADGQAVGAIRGILSRVSAISTASKAAPLFEGAGNVTRISSGAGSIESFSHFSASSSTFPSTSYNAYKSWDYYSSTDPDVIAKALTTSGAIKRFENGLPTRKDIRLLSDFAVSVGEYETACKLQLLAGGNGGAIIPPSSPGFTFSSPRVNGRFDAKKWWENEEDVELDLPDDWLDSLMQKEEERGSSWGNPDIAIPSANKDIVSTQERPSSWGTPNQVSAEVRQYQDKRVSSLEYCLWGIATIVIVWGLIIVSRWYLKPQDE